MKALAVLALAVAWFQFVRPTSLGGPVSVVAVSGQSMLPTLKSMSMIITYRRAVYREGDVIVYTIPRGDVGAGAKVIHRVKDVRRDGRYVTQGDNRAMADLWFPSDRDVDGKLLFVVPFSDRVVPYLRNVWVAAALAAVYAFMFADPRWVTRLRRRREHDEPTGRPFSLKPPA